MWTNKAKKYLGIISVILFFVIIWGQAKTVNQKEPEIPIQSVDVSYYENLYKDYAKMHGEVNAEAVIEENIVKLVIDNEHIFYVDSMEEIEEALSRIVVASGEEIITSEVKIDNDIEVDIDLKVAEEPILSAEILERTFVTSAMENPEVNPMLGDTGTGIITEKISTVFFYENIYVEQVPMTDQVITSVYNIVEDLLQLDVEPAEHMIQSGDSASVIADMYDMKLSELYQLNPWLEEKERTLQIGDEIIVEKLVPELSVVYCKEIINTELIEPEAIYVEDDSVYKGLEIVDNEGSNGIMKVISDVDILNGEIIAEEAIEQDVLVEPQNQIILIGTKPVPENGPAGFFVLPLYSYRLTSSYGPRWGRTHRGIDMAVSTGTDVLAADGGTVIYAGWDGGYGYKVDIDHGNGTISRYAHNSQLLVDYGEEVGQGEVIAKSGNTGNSTGPHLHFEIIDDGVAMNPYDYFN